MPFTPPSVAQQLERIGFAQQLQTPKRWLPRRPPPRPSSPSYRKADLIPNRPVPQDVGTLPMEEELAIRNQCVDNAHRMGFLPLDIRLTDRRIQWKWILHNKYDLERLMDGEIAFVAKCQPVDVDPPMQSVAQSSSSGLLSTDQHASSMRQTDSPPGLPLIAPLALEPVIDLHGSDAVMLSISTPTTATAHIDSAAPSNTDLQFQDVTLHCDITIQEAQHSLQTNVQTGYRDPTIDDPISATGQEQVEQSLTNLRLASDSSPERPVHVSTEFIGVDDMRVDDIQATNDVAMTPVYPLFDGEPIACN